MMNFVAVREDDCYYVDKTNVNKVVSTILDMHSRNLIC